MALYGAVQYSVAIYSGLQFSEEAYSAVTNIISPYNREAQYSEPPYSAVKLSAPLWYNMYNILQTKHNTFSNNTVQLSTEKKNTGRTIREEQYKAFSITKIDNIEI